MHLLSLDRGSRYFVLKETSEVPLAMGPSAQAPELLFNLSSVAIRVDNKYNSIANDLWPFDERSEVRDLPAHFPNWYLAVPGTYGRWMLSHICTSSKLSQAARFPNRHWPVLSLLEYRLQVGACR